MRHIFIVLLSLSLLACSSIRMSYAGRIKDDKGKEGTFQMEKSYDVDGGIPLFCGLSAIFFGGACWYYLVMPTVPQENAMASDASDALRDKMDGKKFTVINGRVDQKGWSDQPTFVDLQF